MRAYDRTYLSDVVENQGKLFDFISLDFPDKDTEDFINTYMKSKVRKSIDEGQPYVNSMSAKDLWEYFSKTEHYALKEGKALGGFSRCGWENFMRIINGIIILQVRNL